MTGIGDPPQVRSYQTRRGFWREATAIQGSVTLQVVPSIVMVGVLASAVCAVAWIIQYTSGISYSLDISPFGFAGAVLGILLVIRLNAGYDRWWEARTVWGGIVNQTRNLVISGLAYGPQNRKWQESLVHWVAVFPHVVRHTLRGEPPPAALARLIGVDEAARLMAAEHPPSFAALRIGELLQEATQLEMHGFAFMQLDRERALLIDHLGACERILATPLPRIYSITIRRFILLFLILLPLALLEFVGANWKTPVITMLVAYPLLTLDQIGVELENPFSSRSLSHLPIDELSANIENQMIAILNLGRGRITLSSVSPQNGVAGSTV